MDDCLMSTTPADILLVSQKPIWPIDHGVSVRGWQMARHLHDLGVNIRLASMESMPADAPVWARKLDISWPVPDQRDLDQWRAGWSGWGAYFRRRLAQHQGLEPIQLAGTVRLVREHRPAVLLGLGLHSPLLLRAVRRMAAAPRTIWYAADELIYGQLTCWSTDPVSAWPARLRETILHGLLEMLFCRGLDGAIGVSPRDTRLLHRLAGFQNTITIRNGVDLDHFHPLPVDEPLLESSVHPGSQSIVFWGRLDFAPNADAVRWFAQKVWPMLKKRSPQAQWWIVGPAAPPWMQELGHWPGIHLTGMVGDVRPLVRWAIPILPMRCGAGIKNKLLEAAAMGRPIVASPRAVLGLDFGAMPPPMLISQSPEQWCESIRRLWSDRVLAASLGRSARLWVQQFHNWAHAAVTLRQWIASLTNLPGNFKSEAQSPANDLHKPGVAATSHGTRRSRPAARLRLRWAA